MPVFATLFNAFSSAKLSVSIGSGLPYTDGRLRSGVVIIRFSGDGAVRLEF